MKNSTKQVSKHLFLALCFMGIGLFITCSSCSDDNKGKPLNELGEIENTPSTLLENNPAYASLFDSNPPHDVSSLNPTNEDLAIFAWREMIALNWRSTYISSGSSNERGKPDPTWSYSTKGAFPSQPVVWETYAHRTELSPSNQQIPQKPFDSAPTYVFEEGTYDGGQGNSAIFNCLDEDSEIASCYLYAIDPTDSLMLLYQAKANRSEYDYLKNNFANTAALNTAVENTKDNIKNHKYYYPQNPKDNCNCPNSIFCLPCGEINGDEGAIEIKTAWRQKLSGDSLAHFFHRKAMYFEKNAAEGTVTKEGIFLLVGMHIIHKTVSDPEFIYATWEHESLSKPGNPIYTYISQGDDKTDHKGTVKPVKRLHPVDSLYFEVSKNVHQLLKAKNKESVWLYYNLTGVQSKITNYPGNDNSYFMANYAIESDIQLQDFYGNFGHPQDSSIRNILKVSENKLYTMGGCKGCHASAQGSGTDFSFLIHAGPRKGKLRGNTEPDVYYSSFTKAVEAAKK